MTYVSDRIDRLNGVCVSVETENHVVGKIYWHTHRERKKEKNINIFCINWQMIESALIWMSRCTQRISHAYICIRRRHHRVFSLAFSSDFPYAALLDGWFCWRNSIEFWSFIDDSAVRLKCAAYTSLNKCKPNCLSKWDFRFFCLF